MKTYTIDELSESSANITEHQRNEIRSKILLANTIQEFHPTKVLVRTVMQESGYGENLTVAEYYDGTDIMLTDTVHISTGFDKKYSIWDKRYHDYKNLSMDTKRSIKDKIDRPQYIGVLSTKKLQNWIEYWDKVIAAIKAESEKRQSEVDEYLAAIESSGLKVQWWNRSGETRQGTIEQGGLRLEITIEHGRVYQQMKLSATSSLENFILLSDNQYKK